MISKTKWVKALYWSRRMRGETQASLVEADDGEAYVVKSAKNPHGGTRTLINEYIGSVLLTELGISTPERAFVRIGEGWSSHLLDVGVCFGSHHPGGSAGVPVYDFIPDKLLPAVRNRDHFFGALVFDLWTSNAASRQSIFFRPFSNIQPLTARGFVAQMIDQCSIFGGRGWVFQNPLPSALCRRPVYGPNPTMDAFRPWLDALLSLPHSLFQDAAAEIPQDWLDDARLLEGLLASLDERRATVPAMIARALEILGEDRPRTPRPEIRCETEVLANA